MSSSPLDRMSPAEVYELVAGFLKRVQPEAPPYPGTGGNRRRPLLSPPGLAIVSTAAAVGGPPPEDGPFNIPGDPDPPDAPGGDPYNPADPPIDFPDVPGGDPYNPTDPPEDAPDDPDGGGDPYNPTGPPVVVVQQGMDFPGAWSGAEEEDIQAVIPRNSGKSLTVFTDLFNNGTGLGPWWTVFRGTWTQTGGVLQAATVTGGAAPQAGVGYNPVDIADGAIDVQMTVVGAAAVKYVLARGSWTASGVFSGYAVRITNTGALGGVAICRIDGGVVTVLGAPITQAFSNGDSVGIRVNGTTIQARRNSVQIGTDRTDATYTTGKMGIGSDSLVPVFGGAVLS